MGRKLVNETSKTPAEKQLQKQEKELKKRLDKVDQVLGNPNSGKVGRPPGGRKGTEKDISAPTSAEKAAIYNKSNNKKSEPANSDSGSDNRDSSSDSESSDSDCHYAALLSYWFAKINKSRILSSHTFQL